MLQESSGGFWRLSCICRNEERFRQLLRLDLSSSCAAAPGQNPRSGIVPPSSEVYAIGNFLAVGVATRALALSERRAQRQESAASAQVMSVFYVAPLGRRCWGLFRVGSMGYKRFVGPGPSLHTASLRHPRARSLKPADWRVACCDL